jgi:hypothetical protein|tara:strand:+ start:16365 stop:16793 length:429 start_codon:yes stop_codon:yes gene_type:complete
MATFKKKDLNELVGGDFTSSGGDRNKVGNSEIETGPIEKSFNDDTYYEKGQSTTTDKVFGRYRQNIPWFAVYSFGGSRSGRGITAENTNTVITKETMEEEILAQKNKENELVDKKLETLVDKVENSGLSKEKIKDLKDIIKK